MTTFPAAVFSGHFRGISILAIAVALVVVPLFYSLASESKTAVRPAAVGKLSFDRTSFTTSGFGYISIFSSNSDGSNAIGLAAAAVPPIYNINSSWNADGTKIVYEADSEVWKMNSDGTGKVNLTNNGNLTPESNPAWSPSGKIAYERGGQIWLMNEDGTAQAAFTFIAQPAPTAPAWSLDGSKLAFVSNGNIWVINANGSGENVVTNNAAANADPAFSPDGTKILFTRSGSGIAVINANGTGEAFLTNNAQDSKPAMSSDGTKIAFVRRGSAANGIYVMDAAGGNQLRIRADIPTNPGRTEHDNPAWQPMAVVPNTVILSGRITRNDESLAGVSVALGGSSMLSTTTDSLGEFRFDSLSKTGTYIITPTLEDHIFTPIKHIVASPTSNRIVDFKAGQTCSTPRCKVNGKIAFVRGSDIYLAAADGTGATILVSGGINEDPSFSPDGRKVVFMTNRDGNYEIYAINVSGSGLTRLTNAAGTDEYPQYSADGSKIVFVSDRDDNQEIYTMNADGTNQQRLTNNAVRDTEPTFSPDGTKIAFSRVHETVGNRQAIFTMNAVDGSNAVQITAPELLFDFTPSYSPDGTKLLFWRYDSGPFTSSFYVANADGTNAAPIGVTGFVYRPSFSPDGMRIIYSRLFNQFTYNVESVPATGGSVQIMASNGHHVEWQPQTPAVRPAKFDFDGDGLADVSVFRPGDGVWYILHSSTAGVQQQPFAVAGDVAVPADFDGDGRTDIAIYRPSNGDFWSLSSSNNNQVNFRLGQPGDIPMPSDIDGDGRSDYVVYRPSNGHWYRASTATGIQSDIWFGAAGDKPALGDFNGDGMADPAVYRPSDGNWWWYSSADGVQRATRWGIAEDIPTPADFDGDGKTDFAVFRPSTGVWYIVNSGNGSFTIFPFGLLGDKPVPADYDGDGKADAAVYRPSDGIWYLLRSSAGFTGVRWGISSDVPVPNAFIR